jgi:FeS assembly protein IscX
MPPPPDKLHWKDTEDLGIRLMEVFPSRDPLTIRFTELRELVESLPDFLEEPGHPCNEQILEAIQAAWIQERQGGGREDDGLRYNPPSPYRPG